METVMSNIYYKSILDRLGSTPVLKIQYDEIPQIQLFCKMEFTNPTGSVKDRAASYILKTVLEKGIIDQDTMIIESSSGNMGIALAAYAKRYGLNFTCVIDPCILQLNKMIMKSYGANYIQVTEPDEKGGYLLNRIREVERYLDTHPNTYWVNQYANPLNAAAYYYSIGRELCDEIPRIDYLFIGVSSGGTISGISRKIKEISPKTKVIAVDITGSVIFGGKSSKRLIPGIGSSKVPEILKEARIDDVIMIDETDTIHACREMMSRYQLFVGGSSGAVFSAVRRYFADYQSPGEINVATILPDRGERYISTVYNNEWVMSNYNILIT